ncbi:hypothetical protein AC739_17860 [Planococcus glaciei]|uniref:Uncharacterized protein n=2 Tax=Planococcus TaxID=1372 RepID=A0A1G8HEF4_9BACL|nr:MULTISPECIES: hypothetical protein [Planococcus]ETP68015.1 hypothetical protein G159_14465 [Planococcus glaciei CHR43]KOF08882.1 hypothetical protein AC739_17860 [Planococcus glaciei]MBX0314822.1 hypothetical protein [Planococcus glaciei]MDN7229391.1 hypothetical protein [Planococcus sp. N064]QDY46404.1 hypothetical protein FK545_16735 [Planococcus glaciei]
MKYDSVKVFLETMCEYNTVKINQVFTAEDGQSLSVRCLPNTTTFEITHSFTQEIVQNDSTEETAQYIISFLSSYDMSKSS